MKAFIKYPDRSYETVLRIKRPRRRIFLDGAPNLSATDYQLQVPNGHWIRVWRDLHSAAPSMFISTRDGILPVELVGRWKEGESNKTWAPRI